MDIYRIIKRVARCRSTRVRLLMLWGAHVMRRRCIGVYLDPVLACNIRCRMCAFSDPEHRGRMRGRLSDKDIGHVAAGLFGAALKVQIGCGAEPTLDNRVAGIVALAKSRGVPYVALTTNGQLLTGESLGEYAAAGLDEVTLSLHGTDRRTYEWLMDGGSFDRFKASLEAFRRVRQSFPDLRLRINYTVNADNVRQLSGLVDLVGADILDVLQVRPVQRLGNTSYDNFDLSDVRNAYADIFVTLRKRCAEEGIECLLPSLEDLDLVDAPRDVREQMFEGITYCYVGPGSVYTPDYNPETDTYRSYHRRVGTQSRLLAAALKPGKAETSENDFTKKLNYR